METTSSRLARTLPPVASTLAAVVGPRRIWLLIAALASASVALYVLVIRGLPPLNAPFLLDWWVIAVGYGLAEVLVVHLQFRRDTHSFSLSEIPLVLGLFFLPPSQLIVACARGHRDRRWRCTAASHRSSSRSISPT